MAGFKAVHCSNGWTMPQAGESVKRETKNQAALECWLTNGSKIAVIFSC
jgi:hypothetical protein